MASLKLKLGRISFEIGILFKLEWKERIPLGEILSRYKGTPPPKKFT